MDSEGNMLDLIGVMGCKQFICKAFGSFIILFNVYFKQACVS
jgi:hypothetical protein